MYTTKAQICIRRDTAANFTSANPTLALGEIAYETDTRNIKVGDGATAWTALGYINPFRGGTAAAPTSNTVLGNTAGAALQSGATDNVLLGATAGDSITTGDQCIVIGSGADVAAATNANSIVIGHNAVGNGSNTTTIGNSSTLSTYVSGILFVGPNYLRVYETPGTGSLGTSVGVLAGASQTSGVANTFFGRQAGRFTTSASNNTAVGALALENNVLGAGNTAIGTRALAVNRADNLVAVGGEALSRNTLGTGSIAIGQNALPVATTQAATVTISAAGTGGTPGTYSAVQLTYVSGATATTYPTADIVVGAGGTVTSVTIVSGGSAFTDSSGTVMTAASGSIGNTTGFTCTLATVITAINNTAVGHNAGLLVTTAGGNTLVGSTAGDALTTGNNNVAVGGNAIGAATTGNNNVAVGFNSMGSGITTGGGNVCIGVGTGTTLTTGSFNTIVGGTQDGSYTPTAGRLSTGNGNIIIGRANVAAGSNVNSIAIIPGAFTQPIDGEGSNTTVIGGTATTQARIRGGTFLSTGEHGQSTQLGQATTLLSGLTGATVTATNLIPANCILLGVTARVTTAVTGATTFDIGDGTTANRFGDDIAIALGTTANNCIAPALIAAATNVVLTANGSNFTAGAVRVTAHFITLVAPTS